MIYTYSFFASLLGIIFSGLLIGLKHKAIFWPCNKCITEHWFWILPMNCIAMFLFIFLHVTYLLHQTEGAVVCVVVGIASQELVRS